MRVQLKFIYALFTDGNVLHHLVNNEINKLKWIPFTV